MNRNGYGKMTDTSDYDYYTENSKDQNHKKKRPKDFGEAAALMPQSSSSKRNKIYVFSDGTVAEHEDETIELDSMTKRNQKGAHKSYKATGSSQYDDTITREIPLTKTDTLQSISIQFRCSVADIKRINGLYTEQEFYARTSIKIPVKSHQMVLQQTLEEEARDRASAVADLRSTKVKSPADVVSSETSEDEESRLHSASEALSVADILELHSDPEDEEAIALLDRQRRKPAAKAGTRDQRKFVKILNRKDEEMKVLAERVQQQTESTDVMTSLRADGDNLRHTTRRKSCLTNCAVSIPVLVITCIMLFGLPALIYYGIIYNSQSTTTPTSTTAHPDNG